MSLFVQRLLVFSVLSASVLLSATPARAKSCELGETIFRDTLYGMGVGAIVGGVYLLTRVSSIDGSDVISDLATASLVGAGVGAVIGVAEAGLCTRGLAASEPGFQFLRPTVFVAATSQAPRLVPAFQAVWAF